MIRVMNKILQTSCRSCLRRVKLENPATYIGKYRNYPLLVDLPVHNQILNSQIRFKYTPKKSRKSENQLEDDGRDDESSDWTSREDEKDAKIIKAHLNSLRMDLVIKAGLNLARNKVENAFYENKIRVNEKKVTKKSANLRIGDEIDIIRGVSKNNPNFLIISRLIIIDATEHEDNLIVQLKRFKTLLVENYSDPWKQASAD